MAVQTLTTASDDRFPCVPSHPRPDARVDMAFTEGRDLPTRTSDASSCSRLEGSSVGAVLGELVAGNVHRRCPPLRPPER